MEIEIYGRIIKSERDFHKQIAEKFNIQGRYGGNIDALWDLLSASVERPLHLIWIDSFESKLELSDAFDKIISVLDRVAVQDEEFGLVDRFTYAIR